MINKIEFTTKNLTSNAGILSLLNYTENNNIFQEFNKKLVFSNTSTEKIKMNHIKTLICGGILGVNKLERFRLLRNDPLIKECGIDIKTPENISRFLNNFNFKETQMLRDISFSIFKKILKKKKLKEITIDIDSSVINVEGNQNGAVKGYNPKRRGNNCYNIQFAFCDQLKAYVTGFMRSGNTYTSNGAAVMIKEIIANLKDDVDNIIFRMDSGYFSEEIVGVIEKAGYQYVIKAKKYKNLIEKAYKDPMKIWEKYNCSKQVLTTFIKPDKWEKERRFVIARELKPKEERKQITLFDSMDYTHIIYVTNLTTDKDVIEFYAKRGNCENYIKEAKYDMNIGSLLMKSFWANEAFFQIMMFVYNLFLLFKMDKLSSNDFRERIMTFRFKYIFLAGKIIKTARQTILKLQNQYPYKEVFD